jgi:hypothetical protein
LIYAAKVQHRLLFELSFDSEKCQQVFIPVLAEKGVEIDEPVKWPTTMKRGLEQA